MLLDTHLDVVTPEGVALHLPVAGPVFRAAVRAEGPRGLESLRRAAEMTRP